MALSGVLSHLAEALAAGDGGGGGDDTRKRMSGALRRFDPENYEGATAGTDGKGATKREVDLKALLPERKVRLRKSMQCCKRTAEHQSDLQTGLD